MKECDNSTRKIHISSNFILSISPLIIFDTLLLRPSLHCNTPLYLLHVRSIWRSLVLSPQLRSLSSSSRQAVHNTVFSSHLSPWWAVPWVRRLVTDRGLAVIPDHICVGYSGTESGFPRCAAFLSCQCHSTDAPNPFIHLQPTLVLR